MSDLAPAAFSKLEEAFFAAGDLLSETATPYAQQPRSKGLWQRLVGWSVPARWSAPIHDAFEPTAIESTTTIVDLSVDVPDYVSYELMLDSEDYEMALSYDLAA